MAESIKIINLDESRNDILAKVIKAMKEADVKDPSPDKIVSSLVEDSIHQVVIKLAIENELLTLSHDSNFIIEDKDMSNILKMTISELAFYLEDLISKKNSYK